MLSKELRTIISGRYKEIYVLSLSYKEFLQFHNLPDGDDVLAKYIQFGGLPGLLKIFFRKLCDEYRFLSFRNCSQGQFRDT